MTAPARAGDEARKNEARKKAREIVAALDSAFNEGRLVDAEDVVEPLIVPILAERDAAREGEREAVEADSLHQERNRRRLAKLAEPTRTWVCTTCKRERRVPK